MAHHINHSVYNQLTERLNRFPQGAPPSSLLEQILKMLIDNREARLVSLLPIKPKRRRALLDEERCLGCGLCVRACTEESLQLERREERVLTPLNGAHRAVIMAIERGKQTASIQIS